MSKITTADCVQEIVKRCQDERVVVAAYCGDPMTPEENEDWYDINDPQARLEKLKEFHLDVDEEDYPTVQDFLDALVVTMTNPKNWKRLAKYKNNGAIWREFECVAVPDCVIAIVREENNQITDVDFEND